MKESWETGRLYLNYAARKNRAFDTVYWKYLDEKVFGRRPKGASVNEMWKTRLQFLGERERAAMEPFVAKKMAESKERILIDDCDPKTLKAV